ncbi:putative nucleotidyltransferase, ribonuclease H [Tanacetum coccineum]
MISRINTNDKRIIDAVCEEYAPELLGFSNNESSGGNPTPTSEPFTSEFILEEIEAYLKDDSILPEIDHANCDPEGDICLIEKLASDIRVKRFTAHLDNAYLEENDKLSVIIAKGLKNDEKEALLKVLKSHKQAIAWKITDIKDSIIEAYTEAPILVVPDWNLPFELLCDASDTRSYWALKHANFDLKTAGDHRKLQLNELHELRDQAYENSLIYKERTKKLHDSKIKNRIFNVGDRVLLFNSRLKIFSGKLKTRWSGPFTIIKVFPYGKIELSQPNGSNFKVNVHRVKHYVGGDLPPKDSPKIFHDLKQHFWWSGMKRDVATFVSKCLTCQQVKIEHQRASGLLQPLEIPVWKWDEISMDFVTGLPRTQRKHDAIWVVVDRLTKSAHFLPIRKDYPVSKLAEMFQQEIVRLHGTPSAIVSDRDPRFTSRFWKGLQKAWGTRLKFSTAFHPETDGQSERTIQTLEDMLRSCALEWAGNWDDYICLVEFAYNNSWHASIKCAPFEMLYGRKCRAPICWDQVGERILEGPEMIEVTNEKVAVAREKLKEAQTRQKSYADRHRRALEFQPGEHVFLKVSPTRGVRRFGIKGKLSPRFIGPFEILDRVGEVSYRLALPPQLSHVHNVFHVSLLRGYKYHPLHVVSYPFDQIREDLSYTEEPESILDRQDRVMRNKTIPFVKILWRNHPEREATWETEESIRTSYPHFLP